MAPETGRLWVAPRTLAKRLFEKGCLETIDEARGKHLVRRVIQDVRRSVLHLRLSLLVDGALRAQEAPTSSECTEKADFDASEPANRGPEASPSGPPFGPIEAPGTSGPKGPEGPTSNEGTDDEEGFL